jgi:hypothetical protein
MRLFASKLALARNPLVRFCYALDPILEFAVPLGQLPHYHVAATGCAPIRQAWSERNSLAGSKLVLCRGKAFWAHAYRPDTVSRVHQQAEDTVAANIAARIVSSCHKPSERIGTAFRRPMFTPD